MTLLGPKLFLIFALMLAAGYVLMPRKKPPAPINQEAVDWVAGGLSRRKPTDGHAEQLKAAASAQGDEVASVYEKPAPTGAAPMDFGPAELTVEALVRAMEAVIGTVPKFVPTLPVLPGLARQFMRNDPQGITFAPLEPHVLGHFTTADPDKPRIVLNSKLKDLHAKGVPAEALADVLVHELDHALAYFLGKARRRSRNQNEVHAFVAEGYYVTALAKSGKGGAVDARDDDPEKDAYYQELKKVRVKLLAGDLPALIRDTYGPEAGGSQRKR